jgi:hypothetical protein
MAAKNYELLINRRKLVTVFSSGHKYSHTTNVKYHRNRAYVCNILKHPPANTERFFVP